MIFDKQHNVYVDPKQGKIYNSKYKKIKYKNHPVIDDADGTVKLKAPVIRIGEARFLVKNYMWEVFNGKVPEGMVLEHIDKNRYNNSLDNLRIVKKEDKAKIEYQDKVAMYALMPGLRKMVRNITTGKVYATLTDANLSIGYKENNRSIARCADGGVYYQQYKKHKQTKDTVGGFKWEWVFEGKYTNFRFDHQTNNENCKEVGNYRIFKDGKDPQKFKTTKRKWEEISVFKLSKKKGGYKVITINSKIVPLHKVVWETFNGKLPIENKIQFKDGNINNINLDNLQIAM